jgi:hypothetical protein
MLEQFEVPAIVVDQVIDGLTVARRALREAREALAYDRPDLPLRLSVSEAEAKVEVAWRSMTTLRGMCEEVEL